MRLIIPEAKDVNSEAGVRRGLEAGQEAKCVLQVEGGDGDVGRSREGDTQRYTAGRDNNSGFSSCLTSLQKHGHVELIESSVYQQPVVQLCSDYTHTHTLLPHGTTQAGHTQSNNSMPA